MAGEVSKSTKKRTTASKRTVRVQAANSPGASASRKVQRTGTGPMAVTEAQIRDRAFQIYLARQGGPGDPCSDWYQAERELRGKLNC